MDIGAKPDVCPQTAHPLISPLVVTAVIGTKISGWSMRCWDSFSVARTTH